MKSERFKDLKRPQAEKNRIGVDLLNGPEANLSRTLDKLNQVDLAEATTKLFEEINREATANVSDLVEEAEGLGVDSNEIVAAARRLGRQFQKRVTKLAGAADINLGGMVEPAVVESKLPPELSDLANEVKDLKLIQFASKNFSHAEREKLLRLSLKLLEAFDPSGNWGVDTTFAFDDDLNIAKFLDGFEKTQKGNKSGVGLMAEAVKKEKAHLEFLLKDLNRHDSDFDQPKVALPIEVEPSPQPGPKPKAKMILENLVDWLAEKI